MLMKDLKIWDFQETEGTSKLTSKTPVKSIMKTLNWNFISKAIFLMVVRVERFFSIPMISVVILQWPYNAFIAKMWNYHLVNFHLWRKKSQRIYLKRTHLTLEHLSLFVINVWLCPRWILHAQVRKAPP